MNAQLFIISPHFPFDVLRVCSDTFYVSFKTGNLCLLYLFFGQFFWKFVGLKKKKIPKKQFFISLVFPIVFPFSILLISALIFTILFLLLALGLFCSPSYRFLRWVLNYIPLFFFFFKKNI